jgi:hypothetical protein
MSSSITTVVLLTVNAKEKFDVHGESREPHYAS